jgi:hypothetical protein
MPGARVRGCGPERAVLALTLVATVLALGTLAVILALA